MPLVAAFALPLVAVFGLPPVGRLLVDCKELTGLTFATSGKICAGSFCVSRGASGTTGGNSILPSVKPRVLSGAGLLGQPAPALWQWMPVGD